MAVNNLAGANLPGESVYEIDACWSGRTEELHDVWFKFTALAKAGSRSGLP